MTGKISQRTGGRRNFVTRLLGFWGILTLVPVLDVVIRYITPAKVESAATESITVDNITDIAPNSSRIVRFGKDPVIIIHTPGGQFKAFFARCTHLGCLVKYEGETTPLMHCNCHGSSFDLTGKNLSGPAPRPLAPLKVTVRENSLTVART
jgi:cytochrome b6-f complex iron-sulfur subunit